MNRVSSVLGSFAGVSSRLFRRLRRLLIVNSMNIPATRGVYGRLEREMGGRNVGSPSRVASLLGRVVTSVLENNRRLSLTASPSVVLMVKIGNMKGAAAVNGLTGTLSGRNGGIVLTTTSAFETTTVRRLRV